jgi:hypothetical protein
LESKPDDSITDGYSFIEVNSPFADLEDHERLELAQEIVRIAGEEFDESFAAVQEGITRYEPLSLLSHLSFYFLTFESDIDPPRPPFPKLHQHHVELLQALALRHPQDVYPWMPTFPDSIEFLSRLDRAAQVFAIQRLPVEGDEIQQQRLLLQEEIRRYTQGVRNWGYPDQIWRIASQLFAPLDPAIEIQAGVRVEYLLAMCQELIALIGTRIHEHFLRLTPIATATSIPDAIYAHEQAFPDLAGSGEGLEQLLNLFNPDWGLGEVQEFLISHLNFRLPDIYTLTPEDFVAAYPTPIEWESLRRVIDQWSLQFGDLAAERTDFFFLQNPVWTQPFIRLRDDRVFCPIPWLLQSFCLELMEGLIHEDGALWRWYQDDVRGKFLETQVEQLFRDAFASAQVCTGSLWSEPDDPATIYENDLLVQLDSYLFVIEAKAGAVTDAALRGAPDRLAREIKKLIVDPSEQAQRFARFLEQHRGPHRFETKRGYINDVDIRSVKEIVCLGVTLDQLGRLYSRWPALRDAGFIDQNVELAPTFALVDLESIFEVLANQSERLHYLVRREEFERNATYYGGELDLFSFYLKTGFNVGDLEFDDVPFMLDLEALDLNPYLNRRVTNEDVPRPQLMMTDWWRAIIERIELRQQARWTDLAVVLLNMSHQEQMQFEARFQRTIESVLNNWQQPGHEDVLYFGFGPDSRRHVVAGIACRQLTPEELEQVVAGVSDRALELVDASRGAILVVDLVMPIYPFRAVALIDATTAP